MPSSARSAPHLIDVPLFQLDLRGGVLRKETTLVALRPKTFADVRPVVAPFSDVSIAERLFASRI